MYKYKRLLASINLIHQDRVVVQYAGAVSRWAQSESVCFGYVEEPPDIPAALLAKHPDIELWPEKPTTEQMAQLVEECFDGYVGTEVTYKITQGSPIMELLHHIQKENIDLVIVGRQDHQKHVRKLPERLARKAPCSVLVVPANSKPEIKNILVGLDFSEHSVNAFEEALSFAWAAQNSVIHCVHMFRAPMEYNKTGTSFAQFAADIERHAQESYQELVGRFDLKGLDVRPVFVLDNQPSHALRQAAKNCQADLIITGARGRSSPAAWVLGSVTEELICNSDIPVLAVKRKGAGMSFLRALLNC